MDYALVCDAQFLSPLWYFFLHFIGKNYQYVLPQISLSEPGTIKVGTRNSFMLTALCALSVYSLLSILPVYKGSYLLKFLLITCLPRTQSYTSLCSNILNGWCTNQMVMCKIKSNHMDVQYSSMKLLERFSRNRQEEENTTTFRLKCTVIA